MAKTSDASMGKVLTSLTVTNRADQILATRGAIAPEQVRSITFENALVDTGATTFTCRCDREAGAGNPEGGGCFYRNWHQ